MTTTFTRMDESTAEQWAVIGSETAEHPAYALAERFADEWDQVAFDPEYDALPLEHFEERVRARFARPRFVTS